MFFKFFNLLLERNPCCSSDWLRFQCILDSTQNQTCKDLIEKTNARNWFEVWNKHKTDIKEGLSRHQNTWWGIASTCGKGTQNHFTQVQLPKTRARMNKIRNSTGARHPLAKRCSSSHCTPAQPWPPSQPPFSAQATPNVHNATSSTP